MAKGGKSFPHFWQSLHQMNCTTGYCSLWSGWYNCATELYKFIMLSMIRLVQLYNCTVKPTNILYNQVCTTVQLYCTTVYCSWSGWYNYTTVLYSCLREALKNIESLTAVIPTLNPTPLYLTAFGFFGAVCFLLIGLLSKAWNCIIFSMIRLVQLYNCTVHLPNVLYDQVGTTTWLNHFLSLADLTEEDMIEFANPANIHNKV